MMWHPYRRPERNSWFASTITALALKAFLKKKIYPLEGLQEIKARLHKLETSATQLHPLIKKQIFIQKWRLLKPSDEYLRDYFFFY